MHIYIYIILDIYNTYIYMYIPDTISIYRTFVGE